MKFTITKAIPQFGSSVHMHLGITEVLQILSALILPLSHLRLVQFAAAMTLRRNFLGTCPVTQSPTECRAFSVMPKYVCPGFHHFSISLIYFDKSYSYLRL